MREKMRAYLDGLFSIIPPSKEVDEAKEELFDGMMERFTDYCVDGMDEQEAYDKVIDSVGDIRELFEELGRGEGQESTYTSGDTQWTRYSGPDSGQEQDKGWAGHTGFDFNLNDFIKKVGDFTNDLVTGVTNGVSSFFSEENFGETTLVNQVQLSLNDIWRVDIGYISESIQVFQGEENELVVKEFMNRSDPALFATVTHDSNGVKVRHGRRTGVFGLRSRIEVYLPADWAGYLSLSSVSGSITSKAVWSLSTLTCKTVSGEISFHEVAATTIRMSATSGSVRMDRAAGNMELHSISGSVRVEAAEGNGHFRTTSGSVRINFTMLDGNVDASSISGGVRLGLPEDAAFEFDARTTSGGIHTGFDECLTFQRRNAAHGFVGSAPFYQVRASSTSGGIHVND